MSIINTLNKYLLDNKGELSVVIRDSKIEAYRSHNIHPEPFNIIGRLNGNALERKSDVFWNFEGIFSRYKGDMDLAQRLILPELWDEHLCKTAPTFSRSAILMKSEGGLLFYTEEHCLSFLAGEGNLIESFRRIKDRHCVERLEQIISFLNDEYDGLIKV